MKTELKVQLTQKEYRYLNIPIKKLLAELSGDWGLGKAKKSIDTGRKGSREPWTKNLISVLKRINQAKC